MPTTIFPAARKGLDIPSARGEMLRLINDLDWGATAVGPMSGWPDELVVTVRLMLASPIPMVMLMGEKGVLVYNDGYAVFAEQRHPAILGKGVAEAWPEIADFNLGILKRVLAGESVSLPDQMLRLNRRGALEDVWLDLEYSPVLDAAGKAVAELVIVSETTKTIEAERALARSEEKLGFALAASGMVGVWDWDIAQNLVTSDVPFATMYGVDPERARLGAPIEDFVEGVHPDDRQFLTDQINAAIAAGGDFRAEYRLVGKDGDVRWVLALGRVARNAQGETERLPGVVVDITERKANEARLAESEAKFRAIADTMPQMVWSTLPDGFHDYYNARWYEYTGVPAGSTDGEGWNDMFHPDDQERAWEVWKHSLETGRPYEIEYRLRHHSGEYRWTLGRALPIRDETGVITRWFGTCTDIHEAKLVAEEREIVAQELSHRIKNIFSVLNGLIGLSARSYPEAKGFAENLRQRIYAMGQAHDFVRPHSEASRPAAQQTSLKALVSELLAPFRGEDDSRIIFEGPDAPIDSPAATPLALLFHELGTNAAKYGALGAPEGKVALRTAAEGDSFRIVWQESGGPTIGGPPARHGFGSRLVDLSVRGQLGGKVEWRWRDDGLVVDVMLPFATLNRSGNVRNGDRAGRTA